jgi:methyl-accepting chemotaxis protein
MNENQLKRANSVVFPVILVIVGYVFVSLLAYILNSDASLVTWKSYLQFISSILAIIVSVVLYATKRDTLLCAKGMLGAASVMYIIIRLFGNTEASSMYAFPILFAAMAYLNIRIVIAGNIVILTANFLRLFTHFDNIMGSDGTPMIVGVFVSVLVAYSSIRIMKLLVKFNEENTQVILEAAEKQKKSNEVMVTVADNIIKHFGEAMEMFDTLTQSLSNSHESVENIANSTESTAEAIQSQAEICGEILDQTSHAGVVTNEMIDASRRVTETVRDGVESVKELGEQARNVSQCSRIVEEVVAELTTKVEKVENFVDTIISISSQTNLLALNASIEAARAGEAGRGFSVVAEEIRKLSEDTKEASNNITNIIQELIQDTKNANESISNSTKCVTRQNELLTETWSKFGAVADEVKSLSNNIDDVKGGMEQITKSSNTIFDHISQLSATSQEVAASSSESLENSSVTVREVGRCREIFESIYVLAQDLQKVN